MIDLSSFGLPSLTPRNLATRGFVARISLAGLFIVGSTLVGCGTEGNSAVQETEEYSFEDVTAQIAAEEAAITEDDE